MGDVELVAVVNSFNRVSLLEAGLPALVAALEALPLSCAIVVFEAGSTDGTKEWLAAYAARSAVSIDTIEPAPQGDSSFSAGVDSACRHAEEKYPQAAYFLFYETDNWIAGPQPLELALGLLNENSELAGCGFTVTKHGGEAAGLGCRFPDPLQFVLGQHLSFQFGLDKPNLHGGGVHQGQAWSLCDVVYTSPLLVKRTAWDQSGGMDASAFPFSDCDIDWAWRLAEAGWKMAVMNVSGVVHDNKEELSSWSSRRVVHFHRARLRLLARHYGRWVHLLKPLLIVRHCLEFGVLSIMVALHMKSSDSLTKRLDLIKSAANGYEEPPASNSS